MYVCVYVCVCVCICASKETKDLYIENYKTLVKEKISVGS